MSIRYELGSRSEGLPERKVPATYKDLIDGLSAMPSVPVLPYAYPSPGEFEDFSAILNQFPEFFLDPSRKPNEQPEQLMRTINLLWQTAHNFHGDIGFKVNTQDYLALGIVSDQAALRISQRLDAEILSGEEGKNHLSIERYGEDVMLFHERYPTLRRHRIVVEDVEFPDREEGESDERYRMRIGLLVAQQPLNKFLRSPVVAHVTETLAVRQMRDRFYFGLQRERVNVQAHEMEATSSTKDHAIFQRINVPEGGPREASSSEINTTLATIALRKVGFATIQRMRQAEWF